MAKDNRSFFEKLTGAIKIDPQDENFDDEPMVNTPTRSQNYSQQNTAPQRKVGVVSSASQVPVREPVASHWIEEEPEEGELTVDVYQNQNEIIIKTMVAGVRPEDLDITITRDMVTIKGKRETEKSVTDEDYVHQELYWGTFSRTVMLPTEIDVEESEAVEKHGLLIIRLPKIDKHKQARLKVKG